MSAQPPIIFLLRDVWARARDKHGNGVMVKLLQDVSSKRDAIVLEVYISPKVYRFEIDDADWDNPHAIVQHICTEIGI